MKVMWRNLWTSAGKFTRGDMLPELPEDEVQHLLGLSDATGLEAVIDTRPKRGRPRKEVTNGDE